MFDNDLDRLGIRSYGVSVTTLEEVFLKVGHGDEDIDNVKAKYEIKTNNADSDDLSNDYSISDNHETGIYNLFKI